MRDGCERAEGSVRDAGQVVAVETEYAEGAQTLQRAGLDTLQTVEADQPVNRGRAGSGTSRLWTDAVQWRIRFLAHSNALNVLRATYKVMSLFSEDPTRYIRQISIIYRRLKISSYQLI